MPSVHVAWAVIVAVFVWRCAGRGWRWVGVVHAVITVLVVVVTANHWWLDGIVATGFVAVSVPVGQWLDRLAARLAVRLAVGLPWSGPVPGSAVPAGDEARAGAGGPGAADLKS
jgi:hypothetical protein